MPTTTPHRDYLEALDVPMTHLPVQDAEAYLYLPPEHRYQLFYASMRTEPDVSVAEALLATLRERLADLTALIAGYEAKHLLAP